MAVNNALQEIISDLQKEDKWTRLEAVNSLKDLKTKEAIYVLIESLNDSEALVRVSVIYALAIIGAKEAIPALKNLLLDKERSWLTYGEQVSGLARWAIDFIQKQSLTSTDWFIGQPLDELTPSEIPDWLQEQFEVDTTSETVDDIPLRLQEATVEKTDNVPDWLIDTLTVEVEQPPLTNKPDFDSMLPEELMTWMEALARRQGASEGFTTSNRIDIDLLVPPGSGYIPYSMTEEQWKKKKEEEVAKKAVSANQINETQFSAYYPFQVQLNERYGLIVYAHTENTIVEIKRDVKKFQEDLGGKIDVPKTAKQFVQLIAGTPITIIPECDEIEFEPATLTKKWGGDWTRFNFDFRIPIDLEEDTLFIRISIQVNGLEIASIKHSIDIEDENVVTLKLSPQKTDNPLAAAKRVSKTTSMYQRIFVSYSRQDIEVVEAYRFAQLAAGHDVFMDTYSIRTGENWQAALAKAIDEADIFQLFWSENAASSSNVRDEWAYALDYKCPKTRCENFIRPVFWTKPIPVKPPQELEHLNFRHVTLHST